MQFSVVVPVLPHIRNNLEYNICKGEFRSPFFCVLNLERKKETSTFAP